MSFQVRASGVSDFWLLPPGWKWLGLIRLPRWFGGHLQTRFLYTIVDDSMLDLLCFGSTWKIWKYTLHFFKCTGYGSKLFKTSLRQRTFQAPVPTKNMPGNVHRNRLKHWLSAMFKKNSILRQLACISYNLTECMERHGAYFDLLWDIVSIAFTIWCVWPSLNSKSRKLKVNRYPCQADSRCPSDALKSLRQSTVKCEPHRWHTTCSTIHALQIKMVQ